MKLVTALPSTHPAPCLSLPEQAVLPQVIGWCLKLAAFALLPVLPCACQREPAAAAASGQPPQIAGETISFATNAPQLAHLAVEPAQPRAAATHAVSGRLAWNEDVTVRVFAPVGGRVVSLERDVGQSVEPDVVLATLASSDYGQAQADAKRAASDLALSEKSLSRARELFANGAAARKDLDAAEADAEKAVSEQQRADQGEAPAQ